ncbi:porin [Pseudomonas sp. B392_1p]|uniref:porin n=1 Tax=Pseudomonas sp. B392_1p TaxID=3457507 RepID=UPI003FD16531
MRNITLLGVAACLASTSAFALEQGEYRLNGFGTAAISHIGGASDAKSYGYQGRTTDSWRGDQLSRLGGQFSYGLTGSLSATVQVVAKAEQDNWKLNLEWAYLAYEVSDQLTVRAGRLRPAAYMFSETLDVGYSYPWLRLPDEVYSLMPVSNMEGADVLYSIPLSFGSVDIQGQIGQAVNRNLYVESADTLLDFDTKQMRNAAVTLHTNDFGSFRYGYAESDHAYVAGTQTGKGRFSSLGHRYDNGTIVTNIESARRRGANAAVDAFYVMTGYRVGDFLPHVTYAQMDVKDAGRQSSWAYGLNYNVTPSVTLKGEYKRVESTKGLSGVFTPDYTVASHTFDGDVLSVGLDFVF